VSDRRQHAVVRGRPSALHGAAGAPCCSADIGRATNADRVDGRARARGGGKAGVFAPRPKPRPAGFGPRQPVLKASSGGRPGPAVGTTGRPQEVAGRPGQCGRGPPVRLRTQAQAFRLRVHRNRAAHPGPTSLAHDDRHNTGFGIESRPRIRTSVTRAAGQVDGTLGGSCPACCLSSFMNAIDLIGGIACGFSSFTAMGSANVQSRGVLDLRFRIPIWYQFLVYFVVTSSDFRRFESGLDAFRRLINVDTNQGVALRLGGPSRGLPSGARCPQDARLGGAQSRAGTGCAQYFTPKGGRGGAAGRA